jgi:hypothetical protein
MTRSIFDPTGGETEHTGSRFTGPNADQDSHMPPDVIDGKVDEDDDGADEEVDPALTAVAESERQADLEAAAHQEMPRETASQTKQVEASNDSAESGRRTAKHG